MKSQYFVARVLTACVVVCLTQIAHAQGSRSVLFGGSNANILISGSPQVSSALTLEAWVYPMAMPDTDAVIFRRYTNTVADPFFTYSLQLHRNNPATLPVAVF
jgi:hypothetical protein